VAALIDEVGVLLEQGRRPQAIESAVAAVRGNPHATGAFTALGRALLTTSRTETALAAFATAVDRDTSNTDAWFFLGVAFDRLGRRVEAIVAWGEVVALDEGHGAAHSRLAAASWMNGDVEEARGHLVSAEALGAYVPAQLAKMIADGEPAAATVIQGHRAGEAAGTGDAATVGPQIRLNPTIGSVKTNETTAAAGFPGEVVAGWNDYSAAGTVRRLQRRGHGSHRGLGQPRRAVLERSGSPGARGEPIGCRRRSNVGFRSPHRNGVGGGHLL